MNATVIKALTENACASIRYRTRKEILDENPDINDYLDEILDDKRVKYVLTWQKPNGFLGNALHAGYIPKENRKYNTGAEIALRFLFEMGVPKSYSAIETGLYYKIPLPDFHNFELLAYTKSWRNKKSIISIAKALEHLIQLSPPPLIYIKSGSIMYAPLYCRPHKVI
jgi:hypothetical protein